jgi:hypothetical protein
MWFYISSLLAKKPAPFSRRPIENISPDDSQDNHDHERKRLVSWIHQRSRDRFMAESHNANTKPVPFLAGMSQLPGRSSLVPHIKSPPQVFTSTLHSPSRSVATNPQYFTPAPPISNTLPQLQVIPSNLFTTISSGGKSNASILSPPPNSKANLIHNDSWPIETYLQGCCVRDSLDLEVHRGRGRPNVAGNRF